jgi:hypothetical protein
MAKEFRAPVSRDFEIIENEKTVCWIRVKPSGILWSQKGYSLGTASRSKHLQSSPESTEKSKRSRQPFKLGHYPASNLRNRIPSDSGAVLLMRVMSRSQATMRELGIRPAGYSSRADQRGCQRCGVPAGGTSRCRIVSIGPHRDRYYPNSRYDAALRRMK